MLLTRIQYPIHNDSGIFVLKSGTDLYFCPGFSEQAQNWSLNSLKIKSPQQANPRKLLLNAVVCVDLTSTYTIISKVRQPDNKILTKELKLLCKTYIDMAMEWFEMAEFPIIDQYLARISQIFKKHGFQDILGHARLSSTMALDLI